MATLRDALNSWTQDFKKAFFSFWGLPSYSGVGLLHVLPSTWSLWSMATRSSRDKTDVFINTSNTGSANTSHVPLQTHVEHISTISSNWSSQINVIYNHITHKISCFINYQQYLQHQFGQIIINTSHHRKYYISFRW